MNNDWRERFERIPALPISVDSDKFLPAFKQALKTFIAQEIKQAVEEAKQDLLAKLPHRQGYEGDCPTCHTKEDDGYNNCLSEVKRIIENL